MTIATKLVLYARRWLLWRKRMKRRIFTAISDFHRYQEKRRYLCNKYILACVYRRRSRILLQKQRCKRVAEVTAEAARARLLRLLETRQKAEQRDNANLEYCVDLIATETLLSGSTSMSLVWDIAQSTLKQAVFENDLESETNRAMAMAAVQEEKERMDTLRKIDDDMARRLLREQDLETQTRQLLCDARGLLASRDFVQFQKQLHNQRADEERNSPNAKKLRSRDAANELFKYMEEFEIMEAARRRGEEVEDFTNAAQEEKVQTVVFNGGSYTRLQIFELQEISARQGIL